MAKILSSPGKYVQGAGEQIVVPPYRIGRQALVPHEHGVVLLEMLGRQLLDGDGAQRVGQVVVDDLAVAVDGCWHVPEWLLCRMAY